MYIAIHFETIDMWELQRLIVSWYKQHLSTSTHLSSLLHLLTHWESANPVFYLIKPVSDISTSEPGQNNQNTTRPIVTAANRGVRRRSLRRGDATSRWGTPQVVSMGFSLCCFMSGDHIVSHAESTRSSGRLPEGQMTDWSSNSRGTPSVLG